MQVLERFVGGALVALMLGGCAASVQTKLLSTSPRTVAVQSFKGMADAQKVADGECAKHGRFARWSSGDLQYIFDCVI